MKSLKYIFSVVILLSLTMCIEKNYIIVDPETVISDIDGDGVTDEQEAEDNTDPDDPCDLRLGNQQTDLITAEWKALDCDGDGVSNGQELEDQTDLLDPNGFDLCEFVEEHQDPTLVTNLWQSYDCDQDGVTNGVELLNDNTDINDPCSLIISSQTQANVPDTWLTLDCDGDGVSNADEIEDGTDPLDIDSYLGAGTKLLRSFYSGSTAEYINNGTLIDKIVNEDNEITLDYTYDNQNRLIHAYKKGISGQDDFNVYFTYNGDQISQINYNYGSDNTIYDVIYDGLQIHLNEPNVSLPNGVFQRTYTFDASGRVLYSEFYRLRTSETFIYTRTDYSYGGTNNFDLTFTKQEAHYLDMNTGELSSTAGTNDYLEITYGYDHHDDVKNPAFGASQSVYVQCILMPDIVGFPGYLRFSGLSESYVSSASRDIKTTSNNLWFNQSYGFYFVQPNQYPRFAYSESWGTETPIEFFYTE